MNYTSEVAAQVISQLTGSDDIDAIALASTESVITEETEQEQTSDTLAVRQILAYRHETRKVDYQAVGSYSLKGQTVTQYQSYREAKYKTPVSKIEEIRVYADLETVWHRFDPFINRRPAYTGVTAAYISLTESGILIA